MKLKIESMEVVGVTGDSVKVTSMVDGKTMTQTYPSAALVEYEDPPVDLLGVGVTLI